MVNHIDIPKVPEDVNIMQIVKDVDLGAQSIIDRVPAFVTKDSGERQEFISGMKRDTSEGKTQYHRIAEGPMLKRWAELLTRGAAKYKDISYGRANWTLAAGEEELARFRESAFRHFMTWFLEEDSSEDHGAAIFFNVNGAEYVKQKLQEQNRRQG